MKTKRPIILAVCGVLVLLCAWYFTVPPPLQPVPYSIAHTRLIRSNLLAQSEKYRSGAVDMEKMRAKYGWATGGMPGMLLKPAPVIDPKFANPTNWPEDSRPEVKAVYQFAKVAKLYNFDPLVTAYKDSLRYQKTIVSATHEADIDTHNQRITDIYSYRDRSHSMTEYAGVTDAWVNGTGTWNEQQMAAETFRILQDLGYTETLTAVRQGTESFTPQPWRVNLPDGGQKIIYPFAVVKLYDANGQTRVTAEYRMGPDGPVGLVDWFSLY